MTEAEARLESIHLYPLKSAGGIGVGSAAVVAKGLVGDRQMMVIDAEGRALTARTAPGLLAISVERDMDALVFTAPGMTPLVVVPSALLPFTGHAWVWDDQVVVLDGGEPAATWLSALLDRPCRLVMERPDTQRMAGLPAGGPVNFADTAPLLLVNAASLAAVNAALDRPVEMARFRPNLIIDGATAFAEDGWERVRIGDVEFDVAGPCDRCVMITLDPGSGASDPQREPLSLLVRHRRGTDGKVYFGQFLVPRTTGRVFAGDRVEVLSRKPMPILSGPPPLAPAQAQRSKVAGSARRDLVLTCVGRIKETPDMTSFRFEADGPVDYLPGQHIAILPEIDGRTVRRNYTISSSPSRPGHLSITVRRVEGGVVSSHLHDTMAVGDTLCAQGPAGKFHLHAVPPDRPLLMLSAGSGITPMMSMLRYIADHNLDRDVRFHHSSRTEDLPFLDELALLQKQMRGTMTVTWNVTGPSGGKAGIHAGRLSAAMLAAIAPDLGERAVLCCGPDGFRALVRQLRDAWPGSVSGSYAEESFGGNAAPIGALPPIERYDVTFEKSGQVASGAGASTLLELARAAGVSLDSDCEAGICGSCKCRVLDGQWQLAANCADPARSALTDAEKQAGYVLACSTNPVGTVTIDL